MEPDANPFTNFLARGYYATASHRYHLGWIAP